MDEESKGQESNNIPHFRGGGHTWLPNSEYHILKENVFSPLKYFSELKNKTKNNNNNKQIKNHLCKA